MANRYEYTNLVKIESKSQKKKLSNLDRTILITFLINPILITPFWNFDSINVPRFVLTLILSSFALYFYLRLVDYSNTDRVLFFVITWFLMTGTCTVLLSGAPLWKQLYGEQGRNTGLFAYLGLLSLMIASSRAKALTESKYLGWSIYAGGLINLSYGILQAFLKDPVNWQNPYGPVVGMLGNPNFMSSFMGFFCVYLSWRVLLSPGNSLTSRFLTLLLILTALYTIHKTQSIQGFFVFLAGLLLLILFKFEIYRMTKTFLVSLVFLTLISVFLVSGFLGKGLLGNLIVQSTFKVRLFFWQSALSMFRDSPIFGHGFDSFGDLYREYRPPQIVTVYGPDLLVNAAHNVFLDIAVSGGILLLGVFIFLYCYILFISIRYIRSVETVSSEFTLLFSLWVAFSLQSLISINQLSISVFGFIVSGLLIASTTQTHSGPDLSNFGRVWRIGVTAAGIILISSSFIIVRPILMNDHDFRNALGQNNGQVMLDVVERWPQNDFYLVVIARIFYQNDYKIRGRELAYKALAINPRNFSALELLVSDAEVSESERTRIKSFMRRIDPQNPRIKN